MISADELLNNPDNWKELLEPMLVYELKALQQKLSKKKPEPSTSQYPENIKKLSAEIQIVINKKEEQQLKKFKKLLSPNLERYLMTHFPDIENIHNETTDKSTPMRQAIETNNINIVNELLAFEEDPETFFNEKNFFFFWMMEKKKEKIKLYNIIVNTLNAEKKNKILTKLSAQVIKRMTYFDKVEDDKRLHKILELIKPQSIQLNLFENNSELENIFQFITEYDNFQNSNVQKFMELILGKINANNIKSLLKRDINVFVATLLDLFNRVINTPYAFEKQNLMWRYFLKIYQFLPHNLKNSALEGLKKSINLKMLADNIQQPHIRDIAVLLLETETYSKNEMDIMIELCVLDKNTELLSILQDYQTSTVDKILKSNMVYNLFEIKYSNTDIIKEQKIDKLTFTLSNIKIMSDAEIKEFASNIKEDNSLYEIFKDKIEKLKNKNNQKHEKLKYTLDCPINDKLFGHIHNDHALKGTHLEGNQFNNTLKYLNKFLTAVIDDQFNIPNLTEKEKAQYQNNMKILKHKVIDAIEISEKINQNVPKSSDKAKKNLYSASEIINESAQFITNKLIQNQGELLIPGGWTGINEAAGHAMLYEFKIINDKWYFLIHNTGAGLNHHLEEETENGILHSSIKAYELPFSIDKIKDHVEDLNILIEKLVEPEVKPKFGAMSFNEDKLYNEIAVITQKIGLIETDPRLISKVWIPGQRSGTCTWKVLASYLKTFPYEGEISYEEVRFEVKRFALEDYFKTEATRLSDPIVQHQFNFALQSFARLMQNLSNKVPPLSEARQKTALSLIQSIENALTQERDKLIPKDISKNKVRLDLPQYHTFDAQKKETHHIITNANFKLELDKQEVFTINFDSKISTKQANPAFNFLNFTLKDPLKTFTEFLEICRTNFALGYNATVSSMIKDFYFGISIPLSLNLPQEELKQLLNHITELNSLYASSCARQSLKPVAENIAVLHYGKTLAINILQHYFPQKEMLVDINKDMPDAWSTGRALESPYFITANPAINAHLNTSVNYIEKLTKELAQLKKIKNIKNSSYMHTLILNHKDCLAELLKLIAEDKTFEWDKSKPLNDTEKAVKYYLDNHDKLVGNEQLKKLNEDVKVCHSLYKVANETKLMAEGKLDTLYTIPEKLGKPYVWVTSDKGGEYYCCVWSSFLFNVYESKQAFEITTSQPVIHNQNMVKLLKETSKDSNKILIKENEGILSENITLLRTLANIRIHPETQVIATIDFMKKEFNRLNQPDIQNYIFVNLFQFDLLEKQLQVNPTLIEELIKLIDKGLKISLLDDKIKDPGLFFLKLSYSLRQLIKFQKIETNFFNDIDKQIDKLINNILTHAKDKPAVKTLLRNLYSYQLLNIDLQQKNKDKLFNESNVKKIIHTITFLRNTTDLTTEDPFMDFQIRSKIAEYIPHLERFFAQINEKERQEVLHRMLDPLLFLFNGIPSTVIGLGHWQGTFPNYKLVSVTGETDYLEINVVTGQNLIMGNQHLPLPTEVTNHPLYTQFFKDKTVLAKLSADGKSYEFTLEGESYRFSLEKNGILQKKMKINNKFNWYQLYREEKIEPKVEKKRGRKIGPPVNLNEKPIDEPINKMENLPYTFNQFGTEIWICDTDKNLGQQWVFIDSVKKRKLGLYNSNTQSLYELNDKDEETTLQLINHKKEDWLNAFKFVTQFESENFIEFWANKKSVNENEYTDLTIRLPRYGLDFKENKLPSGQSEFVWVQDPRYKIDIQYPFQPIPGLDASLVLTPRVGEKVKPIVLLPKHEFRATNLKENEYYHYQFDNENFIMKRKLLKSTKLVHQEVHNQKNYYYSKAEHYAIYTLAGANQLLTDNISDQIYLAYLYLGKRQPLLAFETLKLVAQSQYSLTAEQIEWLRKIVEELPAKVAILPEEEEIENKAIIVTPEFIATRALAASILAHHHSHSAKVDYKANYEHDLNQVIQDKPQFLLVNKHYQESKLNKARQFFEKKDYFKNTMEKVYTSYINNYLLVPQRMRLEREQELLMLRSFDQKSVPIIPKILPFKEIFDTKKEQEKKESEQTKAFTQDIPSDDKSTKNVLPSHIRFRKKILTLEQLNIEKMKLENLKNLRKEHFSIRAQNRLNKVNHILSKEHNILRRTKTLVKKEIAIKLDAEAEQQFSKMHNDLLLGTHKLMEIQKIPVSNWHINVKLNQFLYNFVDYYHIALSAVLTEDKKALQKILQARLNYIAYQQYHNPTKKHSMMDNLIILLAIVSENPTHFKPLDLKSIKEDEFILKDLFNIGIQLEKSGGTIKRDIAISENILKQPIEIRITKKSIQLPRRPSTPDIKSIEITSPLDKYRLELKAIQKSQEDKIVNQSTMDFFKDKKLQKDTNAKKQKSISEVLKDEMEIDYKAGVNENRKTLAQNAAIQQYYKENKGKLEKNLKEDLTQSIDLQKKEISHLKQLLLNLANELPTDPALKMKIELELSAGKREKISHLKPLFHLFLTQDPTLFNKILAKGNEVRAQFNALMFEFLMKASANQQLKRLLTEINKLNDTKLTDEMRTTIINEMGALLNLQRCYDPAQDPALLLFEYLDNKLLFPKQYDYLKALISQDKFGFQSQSVQLIMGGGKSKVLLPLLALKKSTGTNLSIIEVPNALFQVNLIDLNNTTQKRFGKKAHPLLFDDSIECTEFYLRNLYRQLRQIIINREYLITTKESMQALELNYLKLLRYSEPNNTEQARKLKYFSAILNIIRDGDAIIDEVDSTLDVRKQLVYMVGKGDPVPAHEVKATLELFHFLKTIHIEDCLGVKNVVTIQNVIDEKIFPTQKQWPIIVEKIAREILDNNHSPLNSMLLKHNLSSEDKEELRLYLLNQSKIIPKIIENLTSHEKDKIALYKEEISNVLALSMQKLINENIGLSRDPNKEGYDKEIAIPYLANNIPNEGSQFGHYLETINYTIKIQRAKSLSIFIIKTLVNDFINKTNEVLRKTNDLKAYQTILDEFEELTQYKLEQVDLSDEKSLMEFYDKVKDKEEVKDYCLQHFILPQIEKNAITLQSNAQNHGSQFRSIQGMTGTNWNYRCQPMQMKVNLKASLGSDGQTIDHLLANPLHPTLLPHLSHDIKTNIEYLFSKLSPSINKKMHAWIDLGAYFKGISNKEIADYFAQYFAKQKEINLKFILYFGDDNKLYALPVTKTTSTVKPILLESTEAAYIQNKLGCGPDDCFTYYDQAHDTGVDIAQATDAHAYVTLGLKTLERDLLQAVMRMRKLKNSQRIIFVVPKELQDAHPEIRADDWDVHTIIKICMNNQINRLVDDHYRSTVQKMHNVIRSHLLEIILSTPEVSEQQKLIKTFEEVFFTNFAKNAYEQFKDLNVTQNTAVILKEIKENTLLQWSKLLESAKIKPNKDNTDQFEKQLDDIVQQGIAICSETAIKSSSKDNPLGTEVSVQQEQEQELESQHELESEFDQRFRAGATPKLIKSWGNVNLEILTLAPNIEISDIFIQSLESMVKTHHGKRTWEFSTNILVTENFMDTVEIQPNKLDAYKKDALFFLMIQDDKLGTLKTLIITPEEAVEFKQSLLKKPLTENKHIWIETTHQTLLCGRKPENKKLHPDYKMHLEQLAFFSGDTDILYRTANKNSWLGSESHNKLQFLEQAIMPLHKDKANLLVELNEKIATFDLTMKELSAKKRSVAVTKKTKIDKKDNDSNIKKRSGY